MAYTFEGGQYKYPWTEQYLKELLNMAPQVIVGLDIGHGECLAYATWRSDGGRWLTTQLDMDMDGKKVRSLFYRNDNNVVIGARASTFAGFINDVKQRPDAWLLPGAAVYDQANLTDVAKRFRDFIRALWKQVCDRNAADIANQNSNVPDIGAALRNNALLLVVGCPSEPGWTDPAKINLYKQMLLDATGCGKLMVEAESTAAVMDPIIIKRNTLQMAQGNGQLPRLPPYAIIFDWGSSTVDFTFIYMGKVLVCRSCRIAGYELDQAMVRTALDAAAPDLVLDPQSERNMEILLRDEKEGYYPFIPGRQYVNRSCGVSGRDRVTGTVYTSNNPCNVPYCVDETFMRKAATETKRGSWKANLPAIDPTYGKTWKECAEQFVYDTYLAALSALGAPNNTAAEQTLAKVPIYMTGGTSHVDIVADIVKDVYQRQQLVNVPDVSACVAAGLCMGVRERIKAAEALSQKQKDLNRRLDRLYDSQMKSFADKLAGIIQKEMIEEAKRRLAGMTANPQIRAVTTVSFYAGVMDRIVQDHTNSINNLFTNIVLREVGVVGGTTNIYIQKEINELSARIYGVQLDTPAVNPVNIAAAPDIIGQLKLNRVISTLHGFIWGVFGKRDLQRIINVQPNVRNVYRSIRASQLPQLKKVYCDLYTEMFDVELGKMLFLLFDEGIIYSQGQGNNQPGANQPGANQPGANQPGNQN